MLKLQKPAAIATQATLGIALSAPWAVSALAAPAKVSALAAPANTATQSQTTPRLQEGDLVRLRSGGPEMTVKSVRGNWVIAIWWNEAFGGFQSAGFPVAMVDGPITLPPVNVRPQTSPTDRSDHPPGGATPGGPTEGSDHPPGDLSSAGQPNQNPTAQSINQIRQVRPVNATTSTSGSTRPARILPSQQGAGPLQQGTDTNQTIGVPQVRPALALPLQQGTALNQTVLPLQQGTSANQTIGVPQVRPVLVLPQGTVQTALPLPLRQGTGTNQTIGVGQVRPANAGTSMRAQGVIGKRL
jgi:uncharacterized protein YodC (DUF2158 family)